MLPIAELDLPPGRVIEWQSRLHSGRLAVWVSATFKISGRLDIDALRDAFQQLLLRHEVLRTEFRMKPDPDRTHGIFGLLACDVIHPDALIFEEAEVGVFHHAESLRKALIERIDKTIDTNRGPVMLMGVVVGGERSVAYIACDHLVTDGFSCVIKAHELSVMYESTISGEHVELPEVDSYLDYGSQEYAEVEKVQTDDPRVELWRGFVQRNGHVFTEFPVELNTTKGAWHPGDGRRHPGARR